MTLVKTSQGGFNLDNVIRWCITNEDSLFIMLIATDKEVNYSHVELYDDEAGRALEILNGVCIFDTTAPASKVAAR